MDKPVLIIEMPSHLSTEAIVKIHDFCMVLSSPLRLTIVINFESIIKPSPLMTKYRRLILIL